MPSRCFRSRPQRTLWWSAHQGRGLTDPLVGEFSAKFICFGERSPPADAQRAGNGRLRRAVTKTATSGFQTSADKKSSISALKLTNNSCLLGSLRFLRKTGRLAWNIAEKTSAKSLRGVAARRSGADGAGGAGRRARPLVRQRRLGAAGAKRLFAYRLPAPESPAAGDVLPLKRVTAPVGDWAAVDGQAVRRRRVSVRRDYSFAFWPSSAKSPSKSLTPRVSCSRRRTQPEGAALGDQGRQIAVTDAGFPGRNRTRSRPGAAPLAGGDPDGASAIVACTPPRSLRPSAAQKAAAISVARGPHLGDLLPGLSGRGATPVPYPLPLRGVSMR